ncbi:hypothetical protein KY290_000153 [Solanum tuberosum]|uniref:Uncharacterized protein n=1 Tax=Solanum tuberosum TaxID=4113 RepID=A0ABQ7WKQ2_SOLTU|nr:hypothetical protein KY290_000153 [Solanum tuberosum]
MVEEALNCVWGSKVWPRIDIIDYNPDQDQAERIQKGKNQLVSSNGSPTGGLVRVSITAVWVVTKLVSEP